MTFVSIHRTQGHRCAVLAGQRLYFIAALQLCAPQRDATRFAKASLLSILEIATLGIQTQHPHGRLSPLFILSIDKGTYQPFVFAASTVAKILLLCQYKCSSDLMHDFIHPDIV